MSGKDDSNRIIVQGAWGTVAYAVRKNGNMPAKKALDDIEKSDKKNWLRINALLATLSNKGKISNPSQFKHLDGPIYEIKRHPYRIACFFQANKCVLLTHVFDKKSDSSRAYVSKEIEKAKTIMNEHLSRK